MGDKRDDDRPTTQDDAPDPALSMGAASDVSAEVTVDEDGRPTEAEKSGD